MYSQGYTGRACLLFQNRGGIILFENYLHRNSQTGLTRHYLYAVWSHGGPDRYQDHPNLASLLEGAGE